MEKLLEAATHRLVLIIPRGDDGYGYDVRSLQELTAAMALTSGPLDDTLELLRVCSANPHWRNTWLFAAGRLFATPQPHLHEAVVSLIESVDEGAPHRLGRLFPVGPRLALDVIDDGMARSNPKWSNRLARSSIRAFQHTADSEFTDCARMVLRFADSDPQRASLVAELMRGQMSQSTRAYAAIMRFRDMIVPLCDEMRLRLHAKSLAAVLPTSKPPPSAGAAWPDFDEELQTAPLTPADAATVQAAGEALRTVVDARFSDAESTSVMAALGSPRTALVMEDALRNVLPSDSRLARGMTDLVVPELHRRLIGPRIALSQAGTN